MKQIAANFFRGALRLSRHWRSRGTLAKLMAHASPQVAAIAKALAETGAKHLDHEEEELLARIEQRRSFLLQSNRTIAFIDYGAGDPHAGRSEAEMIVSPIRIAVIFIFSPILHCAGLSAPGRMTARARISSAPSSSVQSMTTPSRATPRIRDFSSRVVPPGRRQRSSWFNSFLLF